MKKSLLFSLLTLLTLSGFAQSGIWVSQATSFLDVSSGVRYISAVDTNTAWICAYDGSGANIPRQDYSRTIDGGAHWISGTVPVSAVWEWSMIYGLTDSIAWGAFFEGGSSGHKGQIWRTLDGGNSWTQQGASLFQNPRSFLNNIYFWNAAEGIATGDPIPFGGDSIFEIYTTADSGNTWTMADTTNLNSLDNEANQITHFQVVGDTIWWDSNHAREFRSVDRGHHWTVYNTNLINFSGIIDVVYYNRSGGGIARYYNDTLPSNLMIETSDGGMTWSSPFVPNGELFGGDIKAVPGVDSMLISTGISNLNTQFDGSSYSLDGGHNWITIEKLAQRGVLGIVDSLHMWCGGFTTSPTTNGIFQWKNLQIISCTDPNINSGVLTVSDTALCQNDTSFLSTTGIYAPVEGTYYGFGYLISVADISGSSDPYNATGFKGSYRFHMPANSTDVTPLVNDGTFYGSSANLPWGYYWITPIVFGNATSQLTTPLFVSDLDLDLNCIFVGVSQFVNVQFQWQPPCSPVGMDELYSKLLTINSSMKDRNTLDINISSAKPGVSTIQITDITGRIIRSMDFSVNEGSNHEFVNVENLAQGTYMVKAEMNGVKATSKIFKY